MPNARRPRATRICLACLIALSLAAGCAESAGPAARLPGDTTAVPAPAPPSTAPARTAVAVPWLSLQVFQMTLPAGGVSRSDEFWKHVDEQRVDPPTYDLLLKNGVRVGVAPDDDWDYFKEILRQNHARAQTGVATAAGSGTLELTMRSKVPAQDIFYLDDKGNVIGRTYEHCENLMGVSFAAEPRHPGQVRVSVSPTVRSLRTYWQASVLNEERFIQEVRPEYLYDLNLQVVIPPNSFVVIAPSQESKWPTSLGSTFFRTDGPAEQYEQVLIFVPRPTTRVEPTAVAR